MPDYAVGEVIVHVDIVEHRKKIADFIRMAHCLMSTGAIASAIEDGSYLEIMAENQTRDFEEGLKRNDSPKTLL